jgi:hypothetical protein
MLAGQHGRGAVQCVGAKPGHVGVDQANAPAGFLVTIGAGLAA